MSSEISLPRNKISPDYFKLYKSLGSLIKEYRQWRGISQEMLAESIQISVRQLQNWEADSRCSRIENLHDLSEFTGIPMQALVTLNADHPVWYSLRKRLFSYSSMEKELYSSNEFFRHREKSADDALVHIKRISDYRRIDRIISCHRDIYGTEIPLGKDIIEAAAMILPDLNIIALDCWGHYAGHQVCLPVRMDIYEEVKRQNNKNIRITAQSFKGLSDLSKIVIFYYSGFFTNANVAYCQFLFCTQNAIRHENVNHLIAVYPATKESKQLISNLGWNPVEDSKNENSEICPTIYELKWDNVALNISNLGWKVGHSDTQAITDDPATHETNINIRQAAKESLAKEMSGYNSPVSVRKLPPSVGAKNLDVQNVKTQAFKSEMESCKNPKCTLFRKTGKRNIISNGTYAKKDGTTGRRFQCKECGKSFCSRTGSIFYDLRSPEEKVLQALKLMVKGMTLQDVANLLAIQFITVRHWLKVAARQRKKIDAMLISELDISRTDLDAFWTIVKTNSLQQRAFITRGKNNSNAKE